MRCLIGIDDTDSRFGYCTTHLGFKMVQALAKEGCLFDTYPRLVRLNPNIPFKTRGNAAVCIEFECTDTDRAFETAHALLLENSDVKNGANSGMILLKGFIPEFFARLYSKAISGLANHRPVLRYLREAGIRHAILGNGMGVVGAAACMGFRKEDDHTYELIAYRNPNAYGTPRMIDAMSVIEMEKRTFPHTFNNYDHRSRRILISPHGPDPVFLGIRADSPEVALQSFAFVRYIEELEGHLIYLSNQCTDAHLSRRLSAMPKAYHSGSLEGVVNGIYRGEGGHVYFDLELGSSRVKGAVYSSSGDLSKVVCLLATGDRIRIYGGVRRATAKHPPVINIEKIEVLSVSPSIRAENPICERCGKRMKSEGAGKGFQCRVCGAKKGNGSRSIIRLDRTLVPGIYLPSAGGQRHLTKPLVRYGSECSEVHPLVEGWLIADDRPILENVT